MLNLDSKLSLHYKHCLEHVIIFHFREKLHLKVYTLEAMPEKVENDMQRSMTG